MKNLNILFFLFFSVFCVGQTPLIQTTNQTSNNLVQRFNCASYFKMDSLNCFNLIESDIFGSQKQFLIQHDWFHDKLFIYFLNEQTQKSTFTQTFNLNSGYVWLKKENRYIFKSSSNEIHIQYDDTGKMVNVRIYNKLLTEYYNFTNESF